MSRRPETSPTAPYLPPVKNIGQAALELTRLYTTLDTVAIDITPSYLAERLEGKEEDTWMMFPRVGFLSKSRPILDAVTRQKGDILLGAGYDMWSAVVDEYTLSKGALLLPVANGAFTRADAVTVHRTGMGYDPGDKYVAVDDRVLKAGRSYHKSVTSTGSDGGFVWSVPRESINATFRDMTEVSPDLLHVIDRIRAYEPVAEQIAG